MGCVEQTVTGLTQLYSPPVMSQQVWHLTPSLRPHPHPHSSHLLGARLQSNGSWSAATQPSHQSVHFRLPATSTAMPVIMMNSHIVSHSVDSAIWLQTGPAWSSVGRRCCIMCLAWRPVAAGRTGTLSSAVSPSLWIWRDAIPGGTPGMGGPSKSRMMGRGQGDTSILCAGLVQRCLRSWRPELVHPYSEAQVCQLSPRCCLGS